MRFVQVARLDINQFPPRFMVGLNLVGLCLAMMLMSLGSFTWGVYPNLWVLIGLEVLALLATIVLHEGLHGLAFWVYTGRVRFGVNLKANLRGSFYTTTTAPYPLNLLTPRAYIVTALLPQVLTVIGMLLLLHPSNLVACLGNSMAAYNLGGGAMDLWAANLVRKLPSVCRLEDFSTGLNIWMEEV